MSEIRRRLARRAITRARNAQLADDLAKHPAGDLTIEQARERVFGSATAAEIGTANLAAERLARERELEQR